MEFLTFLLAYFGGTACLVFVLLFGEAPMFARTPVATAHWMLTRGWAEALEWVAKRAFGERGARLLDRAADCCCERSNPLLQVVYLTLMSSCYLLYWLHVFRLMPSASAPLYHIFTGTGVVCLAVGAFVAACTSDPGVITPANAAEYLAAYPPDGLLFDGRLCGTCGFARPARSKHCRVCGSCIARLDHHCGWLNLCIGLRNTRHFLAFLAANLGLCAYAAALAAAAIWGDLRRRGVLDLWVYDKKLGRAVPVAQRPSRVLEYIAVYYGIPAAICTFAALCALLMAGFLAYQLYLIAAGTTGYEVAKMREAREAAARAGAAAAAAGAGARGRARAARAQAGVVAQRRRGAPSTGALSGQTFGRCCSQTPSSASAWPHATAAAAAARAAARRLRAARQ
ncbi:MAG: zf-DHHC-domain-containing protein [Monoraphidium minutum]|nr:MAG: zf-DHHC-domain-containing protein [Monoraphidium minutum]